MRWTVAFEDTSIGVLLEMVSISAEYYASCENSWGISSTFRVNKVQ